MLRNSLRKWKLTLLERRASLVYICILVTLYLDSLAYVILLNTMSLLQHDFLNFEGIGYFQLQSFRRNPDRPQIKVYLLAYGESDDVFVCD